MSKVVKVNGTKMADVLNYAASVLNLNINGKAGDDIISGGSGNDKIDGGKGTDTAVYQGLYDQYVLSFSQNGDLKGTVTDLVANRDGSDTLKNVEFLQFKDALYDVANDVMYLLNSAPVLSPIATATYNDMPGTDHFAQVTGSLSATDADQDPLTFGIAGGSTDLSVTGYDVSRTSTYGTLYLNSSSGAYKFIPDDGAIEALKSTTTASFTLTVSDGSLSDSKTFSLTLNGVNDIATITGTATGTVTEDGTVTVGNVLTVHDADSGDAVFQAPTTAQLTGNYGVFSFNAATGAWGYSLNNSSDNVQALTAADTRTDTLTVKSVDGTASQVITVTIHGSDDTASISGSATGVVTEDGSGTTTFQTASGVLTVMDPDSGQAHFQSVDPTALAGTYGTFTFNPATGSWGYSLNNSSANVQALTALDTRTDTLTVTSLDGTATKDIAVTIHGDIDAPTLNVSSPGGHASDSTIPLNIDASTVDIGAAVEIVISGVPDSYALSAGTQVDDGTWLVQASDLPGLAMNLLGGTASPGTLNLQITASTVEGANTASTAAELSITIAPGADQQVGRIVDGYIAGATVFADANGNGVLDDGEAFAITNADGTFTLTGGSGSLVMFGGTDISTGLPFVGKMTAPLGSTVVTPLTTLVQALVASGQTTDDAQSAVKSALGLANVDLTTFDAVKATATGDAAGAGVLSAAIQVQATVTQITAAAGSDADVFGALATTIVAASGTSTTVNLSDSSTISSVATASGATSTVADAISTVVAAANTTIAASTASTDSTQILTSLSQAANIALGTTTDALANTNFNSPTEVSTLQSSYTGTALTDQVAAAPVGIVSLPIVGTISADTLNGTSGDDAVAGLDGNDTIIGSAGRDVLDGGAGVDLVVYSAVSAAINVNMAAGTVDGDASVGHDTLIAMERVRGTSYGDVYDARGFNAAVQPQPGTPTGFNEFEGMGGNDTVYGNGNTRVSYLSAAAGVTVDVAAGTGQSTAANDAAGIGADIFMGGVTAIRGSNFDDFLYGSDNAANSIEVFEGRGGNDTIDGRGGVDRVVYNNDPATRSGITINLAAGTVVGDSSIGSDTLRSIEMVRGTNFADVYNAAGFSGSSLNAGSNGTFNEFEGMGGNDTVIGNGNTRVSYSSATAAVTVDLAAGTAHGTASGDIAGIGTDTFSGSNTGGYMHGINAVRGSNFNDTLLGSDNPANTTESFDGGAGDDFIDGRGGFDLVRYDTVSTGLSFTSVGISVNMAAGTVVGRDATAMAIVGTDTLRHIEAIRGTNSDDIYDARNFGVGADDGTRNIGNSGTLNDFEGMSGNDIVFGNGNTRISFSNATAGVTVNLSSPGANGQTGFASGDASVGTDAIFGGVTRVRGSNFDDTITGSSGNDVLQGGGGDDTLRGGAGIDIAVLSGSRSAYTFAVNSGVATITGPDGVDTIPDGSIELLQFDDAFMITPGFGGQLNLTNFSLPNGNSLFGRNADDFLVMGANANGRLINLGAGTDTLTLGTGGTYTLNLAGVEHLVGSGGGDVVTLQQNINGTMDVDLGNGTDTLNLANGGNSITVRNVENIHGGNGFDAVTLGTSGAVIINSIENVVGSNGNDQVTINADFAVTSVTATLDLGFGDDTVNLNFFGFGTANLALTNVEHLTSAGGVETVNLSNDTGLTSVDLGTGFHTLNLGPSDHNLSVANVFTLNSFGSNNDNITFDVGPAADQAHGIFATVNQTIDLGTGFDNLTLTGGNDQLSMSISGGSLTVYDATASGNVNLNLLNMQAGTTYDLGPGNDTLHLYWDFDPTHVNVVSVRNVENVFGSSGNDQVSIGADFGVTSVTATLDLGFGDDTVNLNFFGFGTANLALTNAEHLVSVGGVQTVNLTNDTGLTSVDLGTGFHTLNLGPADHNLSVANVFELNSFGSNNDNITFDVGPAANPDLGIIATANQTINLGFGTDTLTLTGGNDQLNMSISGGSLTVHDATDSGNLDLNLLNMQGGATYDLGDGNDTLHLSWDGDPNHFNIVSVQNVETVVGTGNSDQIHILGNSSGVTAVTGGWGADMIWASPDEDHFVYTSTTESPYSIDASGRDTITGFDASQDVFDLRGLNVTSWSAGDFGGQTVVDIYTDGHTGETNTPDMQIGLIGLTGSLHESNFLVS